MPSSDSDGVQVSSDVLSAVAVGVRERPVVALHALEAGDVRVRRGGHAVVHRAARVTGIVVACLTMPTTAGTGSKGKLLELNEINRVGTRGIIHAIRLAQLCIFRYLLSARKKCAKEPVCEDSYRHILFTAARSVR